MKEPEPKPPETHPVSKKYPLPIIVVMVIVLVTTIGIGMYKTMPPNSDSATETETETKKPLPVNLAEIQKELGPGWKKIEMVKNQWYGPFQMKNGTDWQIAEGKVWVKVNNAKPFLDKPGTNPFVSGRQIKFFPATDTAILFFRY